MSPTPTHPPTPDPSTPSGPWDDLAEQEVLRLDRLQATPRALFPRRRRTAAGEPRRVGVEVEFTGLECAEAAAVVARELGGEAHERTPYEWEVRGCPLGPLRVEADNQDLQRLGREHEAGEESGWLDTSRESLLSSLVGKVLPVELVTPPLRVRDLARLDPVLDALARVGAHGTEDGLLQALGTHYNPEVPSTDPVDLWNHLRAYVLLSDWLRERLHVDWTRRLTPYVDRFPRAYVRHLLEGPEPGSLDELIQDHLDHNPTRNRALDMLPLWAHLDPERVRRAVDDPLVKPRPTFHYRLTNSHVGQDHWDVLRGWRLWLVVEDLAAEPERMRAMVPRFLEELDQLGPGPRRRRALRAEESLL